MQFFGRKTRHSHRPPAVSYGLALIAAVFAVTITSVVPVLSDIPFALSFLAIAVSAWFGGVYAGVTCTVASLILLNWVVFPPHFQLAFHPARIIQSAILAMVATFICIIARQREQKDARLERVETFFETTLRSIGDALVATDADGRVVFLNGIAEQLTGWPLADARGMLLRDFLRLSNSETGEAVADPVAKVIASGTVVGLANHTALTSRDGRKVQIEDSAAPIRSATGELLGVVMVFRDVTEKYELEAKRSESENLFRGLVESIGEGFESFDENWNYTYINRYGAAFSDNKPEALIGRNHWEVFPETIGTKFETAFRSAAAERKVVRMTEFYAPLKKWIQVTAYPATRGISVLFQDVSEQVTAEERLRIADRLATAGRLAATVSHEINNPLSAVGNLLYLTKSAESIGVARQYAAEAERQLYRASHIAKQTLTFYKGTGGSGQALLSLAIRDAISLFQNRIEGRGVTVRQQLEADGEVHVSPGELVQVIANLLSNALDAAPPKSEIQLTSTCNGDSLVVTVIDEGEGIQPGAHDKIFEPFFTTKADVGTGLGLWVTKNIVEKHGGTIHVANSANGDTGAVFTVTLPLTSRRDSGSES
jgi:PAS domain S-box-containing protein